VWIATPDSGERPFEPAHAADSSYVRFPETDQPGRYRVRVADPPRPPYSLSFVVRRPPEESDPRPLGPERWQWLQRTLGVQRIDVHDDFFDLGGHSLLVIQLHRRVRPLVARPVAIADLFRYPTVHKLTAFLQAADREGART